MKRIAYCIVLLALAGSVFGQTHTHQQGTIVRMRMTECLDSERGFMAAMSGGSKAELPLQCPEYVLVADKVVYVISGKNSEQLLPLAEVTRFRFQKNEMLIRVDDATKESRFHIKAMVTRPEWERSQMLAEAEANAMISRHLDPTAIHNQQ